jgi:hypothetical protein
MAKDDRLFAPFPIELDEHPKIIGLSDAAFRAFMEAIFYSRRMLSDGFLDERIVLRKWGREVADELTTNDHECPSWVAVDRGWQIHDFENHHPLKAEIEAKRLGVSEARSEAGKRGAAKRWDGKPIANEWQPDSKPLASDSSESESQSETETTTTDVVVTNTRVNVDALFNEAWHHWPKRTKQAPALAKFKIAARATDPAELAGAIQRFGDAYSQATSVQFTPSLDVWLNQKRWTEPLPVAQVSERKPTRTDNNLEFVRGLYADEQRMEIQA